MQSRQSNRWTGRQPTGRYTDRSTHGQVDRSTHGQVRHVVYVATLCTADRPTGRPVYTPIGQHVVYKAKLCIADRPTGRHTDRSTHGQVQHVVYDSPIGGQADRSTHGQFDTWTG